jgi:5-methylcytosine-specific restriction endonuclease McrA
VCAECTELFDRRQVEVDHIEPIAFSESLEEWIEALYCGDMQVLCKPCHKIKSNSDKKRIAEWKKKRKK